MLLGKSLELPTKETAIKGRHDKMPIPSKHAVLDQPLLFEEGCHHDIWFAMGCFWGAERLFWQTPGVISTAVGYAGGFTENPTYEEVCSGGTGHTEVVRVYYDSQNIKLDKLLQIFWENHDPTSGMRQGHDVGTQYRSAIFCTSVSTYEKALHSQNAYQRELSKKGLALVTTTILQNHIFYYAEDSHQQYLAKNPHGYCGIQGTGVSCPIATG